MNRTSQFERDYQDGLAEYVNKPDESTLASAYELGRRALADGVGIVDIVNTHRASRPPTGPADVDALAFLVECLAPLEMAFRGFTQAIGELRTINTQLEQRVAQRTRSLDEANNELRAFTYSVSHDLRAPLRAVDSFSAIVREEYGSVLDDEGRHYLERIGEGTKHMASLIDGMLVLSRLARYDMVRIRTDMSRIAQEIINELQERQPERVLEVDIQPDLVVVVDPQLIRIALTNLLDNAVKFTGTRPVAHIEVGADDGPDERVYFVRDNGIGFATEESDKLFQPFARLSGTANLPGTGIGLATVQRVIHRHSGRIWAEGQPDVGATFFFTLPAPSADEPVADQPSDTATASKPLELPG